jgi:hypothetical protein
VGGKVAGTAAGAAVTSALGAGGSLSFLGASAAAGPIGLAAGAIIAIAISFFSKKYVNVQQWDQGVQMHVQAWQKYLTIQGHVAGRALGLKAMVIVMKGAMAQGLFPGNTSKFCFHEGCVQGVGNGALVDTWFQDGLANVKGQETLTQFLKMYNPSAKPANVPDAIYFTDNLMVPWFNAHRPPGKAWIVNGMRASAQIHQLIYDCVDAFLGQHAPSTTPYVEYPAAQIQQTAGAIGAPTTGPATNVSAAIPGAASAAPSLPAGVTQVGTDPSTGAPIYAEASTGTQYEYVNGQFVPYQPTGITAAGVPTTGGISANTLSLIQSLLAQGQSQQQTYNTALSSLASQGVNTQSPAVQSQLAQAVQNPTAAASALGIGGATQAGMSPVEIGLLLAAGVGILFFGKKSGWNMLGSKESHKGKKS